MFSAGALFVDEHCLISVRSSGYEEHVKRLHFKDIQAIVVSKSRRFGVSRRVIFGVLLLLIGFLIAPRFFPLLTNELWALTGVLVLAWLSISIGASCRCRVYTAVSQEELLSIRRPWTASKLLTQLTPLIEAAQGTLPAGWHESLADHPIVFAKATTKANLGAIPAEGAESRSGRLIASGVLVASLLLDAVLTSWDLQRTQPMPNWIGNLLALIQAAAAVWILIQNRGIDISLQRLGAAVLIFLGLSYYGQVGIAAMATAQAKRVLQPAELRSSPIHRTYLEIYVGGCLILGILGAFLTLAGPTPRRPGVLVE